MATSHRRRADRGSEAEKSNVSPWSRRVRHPDVRNGHLCGSAGPFERKNRGGTTCPISSQSDSLTTEVLLILQPTDFLLRPPRSATYISLAFRSSELNGLRMNPSTTACRPSRTALA